MTIENARTRGLCPTSLFIRGPDVRRAILVSASRRRQAIDALLSAGAQCSGAARAPYHTLHANGHSLFIDARRQLEGRGEVLVPAAVWNGRR
jgi:hypothetical protein